MRRETGFTLVELLVTMLISLVIFGATLSVLTVILRQGRESDLQSEAQNEARQTIDRLMVSLRNALAAPSAAPATVERIGPYDVILQTVEPLATASPGNPMNVKRVRYCLDAADPANATLRLQQQTWPGPATPPLPSGTECPAPGWGTTQIVASNLTNVRSGRAGRPVFECWPADAAGACPQTSSIRSIRTSLVVDRDPASLRGERELAGTSFLRNANRPPIARFAVTQVNGYVSLNASASDDPEGSVLSYAWYKDGVLIPGATGVRYSVTGLATGSTPDFKLVVTDQGGLKSEVVREVTVT